jgi:hypothetical protein
MHCIVMQMVNGLERLLYVKVAVFRGHEVLPEEELQVDDADGFLTVLLSPGEPMYPPLIGVLGIDPGNLKLQYDYDAQTLTVQTPVCGRRTMEGPIVGTADADTGWAEVTLTATVGDLAMSSADEEKLEDLLVGLAYDIQREKEPARARRFRVEIDSQDGPSPHVELDGRLQAMLKGLDDPLFGKVWEFVTDVEVYLSGANTEIGMPSKLEGDVDDDNIRSRVEPVIWWHEQPRARLMPIDECDTALLLVTATPLKDLEGADAEHCFKALTGGDVANPPYMLPDRWN